MDRKIEVVNGNQGDWISSAGTTSENSEWIVLSQNDWTYLGSHPHNICSAFDCAGTCADGYESWQGDGYCDDGSWGFDFTCPDYGTDCGDCGAIDDPNGVCGDDGNADGAPPVETEIALSFKEIELITREKVEEGF